MWPNLHDVDHARAHGSGAGVTIAVLDTGIDQSHPDLSEAVFEEPLLATVADGGIHVTPCEAADVYGHGTGVAGIIHRLAPKATLRSIRVLDQTKRQYQHEVIKAGALHALHCGATILHCSFGRPGSSFSLPVYKAWTDEAFERDRHVVAASSNNAPDEPHWPASFPHVLSVTTGDLPTDQIRYRPGTLISFEAAGIDISVPVPGGQTALRTGSSFAAAHLTGLLARLISCFPEASPSFAHDLLRRVGERDANT